MIFFCEKTKKMHGRYNLGQGRYFREELITPLLRRLNFWCECGISYKV